MPPETLNIVTLSICIFTLILAAAALMPQLKRALALMRDTLLMMVMAILLSLAGFVGWGKIFDLRQSHNPTSPHPSSLAITDLLDAAVQEKLDPLPLPSIVDEETELPRSDAQDSEFTANRSSISLNTATHSSNHASGYPSWDP